MGMRPLCFTFLLAGVVTAQSLPVDLSGHVQVVGGDKDTTPNEAFDVAIRNVENKNVVRAKMDHDGNFTMKGVLPGRYELDLPFPGRFISAIIAGTSLALPTLLVGSSLDGPLNLVVTVETSGVALVAEGLPRSGEFVAILAPADPFLTLRNSCYAASLLDSRADFKFIPPGTYRVFVVDRSVASAVSAYAPRVPDFLRDQSRPINVIADAPGRVTATYIEEAIVRDAVRRAGPLNP